MRMAGMTIAIDTNKTFWLRFCLLLWVTIVVEVALAATDIGNGELKVTTSQLAADLADVRKARILFLHHSVGVNILEGIKRLDAEIAASDHIRLVNLNQSVSPKGSALLEISGGRNTEPKSKIDFFATTIRNKSLKPDLAFMKLCFVDFDPRTDVQTLFSYYKSTLEALKQEFPQIRFAHVTVPITERPTGLKWLVFRSIGKEVWEDEANVKRAQFNALLKQSFNSDPLFDLARVESTSPSGELTIFTLRDKDYLSLYPGYSKDGGHLNLEGERAAGAAAIRFMAEGLRHGTIAQRH
jgi:hypothetical protein